MAFSIATWNINSVRLRMPLVEQFLRDYQPDVLCLQETKCPDDQFPAKGFRALGYEHIAISGQKGYHGVATVSRRPLGGVEKVDFCNMGDCRHLSAVVEAGDRKLRIHNFYVPAGGDEPDPAINQKFAHKLAFLEEMRAIIADRKDGCSSLLVGDLNIAPLENDVWSHKQLLKIVSHTPIETETLEDLRIKGGWSDPCAISLRRTRKSIPGGAIAPRIGMPPIAAAGWTMYGVPLIWKAISRVCRCCAMRAAGTALRIMCR
ncbi:exodeoxyribonuclease III [Brucella vulpis]|nr:exodeoxyribonuclease III [Brucella vulpis]CUW49521.1 exodeoxyribonuclease III [Brucella vulpis]